MKILKLALLSFVLVLGSCSKNDEKTTQEFSESMATRMYLNSVREGANSFNENSDTPIDICFSLVFPVEFVYENGNQVTINSMEALKEAIYAENSNFHINSIVFPFMAETENDAILIENESQFLEILQNCDIATVDNILANPQCFQFVFPFTVIKNDGSLQPIANQDALNDLINSTTLDNYWVDFQYPFQIIYNNENVSINDIWDFYNYADCTPENSCLCPTDINPVCVASDFLIIQFDNACWAQCAGYSEADFVNCN